MSDPSAKEHAHGLATQRQLLSMSGLQFMRGILEGKLPAPPIAKTLNFRLTDVAEGRVSFDGAPQYAAFNPMGTTHGGWYGTILDSAMGCAVMTMVPQGSVYTTLEFSVNIMRSIPAEHPVRATATVAHAGRTTAVASAQITSLDGEKIYAIGTTTCVIMKVK
ncbi:MAG: PaaI family thioesterase [Pseudomonadota bacterium]